MMLLSPAGSPFFEAYISSHTYCRLEESGRLPRHLERGSSVKSFHLYQGVYYNPDASGQNCRCFRCQREAMSSVMNQWYDKLIWKMRNCCRNSQIRSVLCLAPVAAECMPLSRGAGNKAAIFHGRCSADHTGDAKWGDISIREIVILPAR